MPPELDLDRLRCRASIDFLTIETPLKRTKSMPKLGCISNWSKRKGEKTQTLTLHDPSLADIQLVRDALDNPVLRVLELSVDLSPDASVPRDQCRVLLENTFVAIAARYRPEDMTNWGYGPRGGLTGPGQVPQPFHQRLPSPSEELIYGRRGTYMQSKLYLKTVDQNTPLPDPEHRVRMEITVRNWGLMEMGLNFLQDLVGFQYRSQFTKHFRIVSGPRVRKNRPLSEKEFAKRERRMNRAWITAGVGKFAVAMDLPPDTDGFARAQIKARAKNQLPLEQFVLLRHQRANAVIGDAFKKLQLRMSV